METAKPVGKLWNKSFVYLIIVSLITTMGFSMIFTLIVDYSARYLGATLAMAGMLSGIFSLSALAVRPFSGLVVDLFNKKVVCILANLVIALACLGYAFAPNANIMLAFRVLHGAAFAFSGTANMALISFFIPRERLGEGIGYYGLGMVFSQAIGPGIGAVIADTFGYQFLFFLIVGLSLVGVAMLIRFPYHHVAEVRTSTGWRSWLSLDRMIAKEVLIFALAGGVLSFGSGIISAFLKVMCDDRGIAGYALFFTVGAIFMFVIRPLVGRLADTRLTLIVTIALISMALAMAVIGYAAALWMILVAAVLRAVGQGGGMIALQAECLKRAGPKRTGVATSTYFIGADIGQGISPAIGGLIAARWGYRDTFLLTGILILVVLATFLTYQRRNSGRPAGKTASSDINEE